MSSVVEVKVKISYHTCHLIRLQCCKVIWLWIVTALLVFPLARYFVTIFCFSNSNKQQWLPVHDKMQTNEGKLSGIGIGNFAWYRNRTKFWYRYITI